MLHRCVPRFLENVNCAVCVRVWASENRKLLTPRSGPGIRNGVQTRTPRKKWGRKAKNWGPGHIYPEIEGQWLNLQLFLTFEVAKLNIFGHA